MKKLRLLLIMGGAFLLSTNVFAQDIPTAGENITWTLNEMKLVGVVGTPPSLTFVQPATAGAPIADAISNASYLQYTSIVDAAKTNKISVKITGDIPTATELWVVASANSTGGKGTPGTQSIELKLSSTDQVIVSGIGSVYTGIESTDGRQLTYRWTVLPTAFATLKKMTGSNIAVTYTIADTL
jgi:hypothetical protein